MDLTSNNISALPASIGGLTKLEELYLATNNLSSLPEEMGNLIALQKLDLSNTANPKQSYNPREIYRKDNPNPKLTTTKNSIQYLPNDLSKWNNLKFIRMSNYTTLREDNLFKSLFTIPSKGFSVELENVNITTLPFSDWIRFNARVLNLRSNKLTSIPADIINAPYLEFIILIIIFCHLNQ